MFWTMSLHCCVIKYCKLKITWFEKEKTKDSKTKEAVWLSQTKIFLRTFKFSTISNSARSSRSWSELLLFAFVGIRYLLLYINSPKHRLKNLYLSNSNCDIFLKNTFDQFVYREKLACEWTVTFVRSRHINRQCSLLEGRCVFRLSVLIVTLTCPYLSHGS